MGWRVGWGSGGAKLDSIWVGLARRTGLDSGADWDDGVDLGIRWAGLGGRVSLDKCLESGVGLDGGGDWASRADISNRQGGLAVGSRAAWDSSGMKLGSRWVGLDGRVALHRVGLDSSVGWDGGGDLGRGWVDLTGGAGPHSGVGWGDGIKLGSRWAGLNSKTDFSSRCVSLGAGTNGGAG